MVPNFRHYPLKDTQIVVEIDPNDGSDWPYHYLVYCEYDETTQKWVLSQNEKVDMGITKDTKEEAIKEACYQLVVRLNGIQGG